MRARTTLLVAAVLLAGFGLAGAATAAPTDVADRPTNETTNESGGGGVGICVTGVDSPCNGEQWDGDEESTDRSTGDAGTAIGGAGGGSNESADVGVCVTGVDSPCNGEAHDGDRSSRADETTGSGSSGTSTGFDVSAVLRVLGSVGIDLPLL